MPWCNRVEVVVDWRLQNDLGSPSIRQTSEFIIQVRINWIHIATTYQQQGKIERICIYVQSIQPFDELIFLYFPTLNLVPEGKDHVSQGRCLLRQVESDCRFNPSTSSLDAVSQC